jgi:hypothetical protein
MAGISPTDVVLPPEWYAAYPGTRYLLAWTLMTWSPRGVLDASRAETIIHWLEAVEPHIGNFNRFIDFSHITKIELGIEEVAELALRRKEGYTGGAVRTAILAVSPLAYGIARMYEQLLANAPIDVHVVSQLSAAGEVLRVPIEVLESLESVH